MSEPQTPNELLPSTPQPETTVSLDFNPHMGEFNPEVATETEWYGLLSGSEHSVLYTHTQGDTIVSKNFVQCGGALCYVPETQAVFLVHESTWSASASLILQLHRPFDIEVYTVCGPYSSMPFETIAYEHQLALDKDIVDSIDRNNPYRYPPEKKELHDLTQLPYDGSGIEGLHTQTMQELIRYAKKTPKIGETRLLGRIRTPLTHEQSGRWSLTYRPNEDKIRIYDSGARKLMIYRGFSK